MGWDPVGWEGTSGSWRGWEGAWCVVREPSHGEWVWRRPSQAEWVGRESLESGTRVEQVLHIHNHASDDRSNNTKIENCANERTSTP